MRWDGSIETWDADDPDAIIGSCHTRSQGIQAICDHTDKLSVDHS